MPPGKEKGMKRLVLFLLATALILLTGMGAARLSDRLRGGDEEPDLPAQAARSGLPEQAGLPEPVREEDWRLRLVNAQNPLPEDFEPETEEADGGYLMDSRAVEPLRALLEAGRAAGLDLVVTSGWRSWAYQEKLFEDKVERVMIETGLSREEAEELAADEVARPGTSEHQLGLAVDIISNAHPDLDESWAQTEEAVWLREHCAEYGFILRYPPEKSELTGIVWEPWHFRYVGLEAAVYIMENDLCLEEYLEACP